VTATRAGRPVAVCAGLVADRLLGEPPDPWHPVAAFGKAMESLEPRLWADRRQAGVAYAALGTGAAAGLGAALSRRTGRGAVVAATYVSVAGRSLLEAAGDVAGALEEGDLVRAREQVGRLVGRETADLDEAGVCRAAVESVAENTVDAVTAPLVWAAAAGAPGVLAYRAVNTLDAMVGHHNGRYERFGWASARADDVANWLPARITAALVAAVRPRRAAAVRRAVRAQAPAHPSPNAGVVEAAFAAALGVRLGGVNHYAGRTETRAPLGWGPAPTTPDIRAACRLSRDVTVAAGATLIATAAAAAAARRP